MHFPIFIGVRRSSFLAKAVIALHAVAAGVLFVPDWPLVVPAISSLILLLMAVRAWRIGTPQIDALRLFADGHLEYRLVGETRFLAAEVLPGATVHPVLTLVRIVCDGRTQSIAFLPDSATVEEHRRLRIWLRWCARDKTDGKTDSIPG